MKNIYLALLLLTTSVFALTEGWDQRTTGQFDAGSLNVSGPVTMCVSPGSSLVIGDLGAYYSYFVSGWMDANQGVSPAMEFGVLDGSPGAPGGMYLAVGHGHGSSSSPTNLLSGDQLGLFAFEGFDAGGAPQLGAQIVSTATENWTESGNGGGANIVFQVSPNGGSGFNPTTAMTIGEDFSVVGQHWALNPNGSATFSPAGFDTNNAFLSVTGTMPGGGTGNLLNITSGSGAPAGQQINLLPGYTGAGAAIGNAVNNTVVGTGNNLGGDGNFGALYQVYGGNTAGLRDGVQAWAGNSTAINVGFSGAASDDNGVSGTPKFVGVHGRAFSASGTYIGGHFSLQRLGAYSPPAVSAGLLVDNNSTGVDIAKFYESSEVAHIDSVGNLGIEVAGNGLQVKEGSNAKQGTATLVAGTVVVSDTSVTANSRIFLTCQNPNGGTPGAEYVSARTAATSFTITSTNPLDTCIVAYEIFEPA